VATFSTSRVCPLRHHTTNTIANPVLNTSAPPGIADSAGPVHEVRQRGAGRVGQRDYRPIDRWMKPAGFQLEHHCHQEERKENQGADQVSDFSV
jgi:hypothetical protein